ncbi:MAG TPA: hypothetical protein VNJ54_01355 [Plantibacter sp.]|uniref:hypothetical protein n=1 Tax=Plantibacter sp. TaxID=1871045 RepID=UPI002BD33C9C|nr:hypothetical protein [Plantibacter sp.]
MARRLLLALAALLLTGCAGGDGDRDLVRSGDLSRIVLQEADLPQAFIRFDEGRQARADSPTGERADASRFGRQGGWKARYSRAGSPATRGPLVVESLADVFESSEGAEQELRAHREQLSAGGKLLDAPGLGDGAVAGVMEQGGGPAAVRFYTVVWRRGNVTASVVANGFAARFSLADVLSLARAQDRRITRALE